MKAQIEIGVKNTTKIGTKPQNKGIRHYLEAVRKAVGKYVTIEKDAIFKDPNWPHLWDHER